MFLFSGIMFVGYEFLSDRATTREWHKLSTTKIAKFIIELSFHFDHQMSINIIISFG